MDFIHNLLPRSLGGAGYEVRTIGIRPGRRVYDLGALYNDEVDPALRPGSVIVGDFGGWNSTQ